MEKHDLSLEEILNAYAPEPEKPVQPTDAQELGRVVAQAEAEALKPLPESQARVSYVQAQDEPMPMRVNVPSKKKTAEPEQKPIVFADDTPKIRRMSDSTRAREIAKNKKKNRHRKPLKLAKNNKVGKVEKTEKKAAEQLAYQKERPEGEYAYTQIHGAKKAKNRKKVKRDPVLNAAGTETIHLDLKDVVTVAQLPQPELLEPVEVKPAPRAEKTSIDLSEKKKAEPGELDVSISRSKEEAEAENRRRQQEMSSKMELENAADIRHDIAELRSAINFRIFALTLVLVLSSYMALSDVVHSVWLDNLHPIMKAVLELLLGLGAAVVCLPVLKNGFRRLLSFHADTDSLAAVSLVACMAACIYNLIVTIAGKEEILYFLPCAILTLLLHTLGKLLIVNREQGNLRLVTKRFNCSGLCIVENEANADTLTRGVLGDLPILATLRRTDSLIDFRKYTYSSDLADRFCRIAAPLATIFAIGVSVVMTSLRAEGVGYCLELLSMFTAASSCAAITFVVNLPLLKATRQMVRNGALLLGYQSVDDFYDTNSLMVDAASLFPEGTVKLSGVKMFTNTKMEEVLLNAASLSYHAGSVFSGLFTEVMQGREKKLYRVENYVYEDSMGLCGWIHNQRVLLGSRELMAAHNIEGLPSVTREEELVGAGNEAVYLSVSGNLMALFLVELHAGRQVKFWAKQAVRHGICLILRSVDPVITIARIASLFEIPQEMIKIIPQKLHAEYAAETSPVEKMSSSMATTGGFGSVAQLIVGAKVLRSTAMIGVFVQAVSLLLGLGIVLLEALVNVGMTPGWMLVLQCILTVITVMFVNIRKIY